MSSLFRIYSLHWKHVYRAATVCCTTVAENRQNSRHFMFCIFTSGSKKHQKKEEKNKGRHYIHGLYVIDVQVPNNLSIDHGNYPTASGVSGTHFFNDYLFNKNKIIKKTFF